ncbi:Serine/threonine protein kinase [Globisporangium polare]
MRRGTWGGATPVVIKCLLQWDEHIQRLFAKDLEIWSRLAHPHILKLFGGNHMSEPVYIVCEDATKDNFRDQGNRQRMWRLFYQVALGSQYLHSMQIRHGRLKCSNLFVGNDDLAKISDFGFDIFPLAEFSELKNTLDQDAIPWKALEFFEGGSPFKSDVYSLGMCIIEAVTGEPPWGPEINERILDYLYEGLQHPRPSGFSDKRWDLVSELCQIKVTERIELSVAIDLMKVLVDEEELGI